MPDVPHTVAAPPHPDRVPQVGYLPLSEAATYSGVSIRTLQRWIQRGLPTYRAGPRSKLLIRPGDIDQFLTRQQAPQPDLNSLVDEVMTSVTKKRIA